ncbi:hypothetical protein KKB43_02610 [Patescibacteria group bacterium]|nr:hypothetical protein [Patescibacteria group bacterium]
MNDKDKSYFIKLILVSVVFITFLTVLGLTAELVKNKPVASSQPQVSILSEPTVVPVVKDEIADWQTYKNEDFGYEIKYPANWEVKEGIGDNKMDFITSGSIILLIDVFPENTLGATYCTDHPTDKERCEEIIIDGQKNVIDSYSLETVNIKYPFGGIINIASTSIGNEDKKIFRSILSTFKLDKNTSWKTYRNEKYGFELQYPRSLILSENNNYKSDNDQALDKVLLSLNKISDDNFLTINRFEIGKNETFKNIIENNSWLPGGGTGHADLTKFKSVKIGDNNYYYRYFCGDPSGSVEDKNEACGFFYYYWLVKDQNVYEFELFDVLSTNDMKVDFENSPSNLEFKKILSTFKFTK